MKLLKEWQNGNASVKLFGDGTREIEWDGDMALEWPLNIDIRVSTRCAFGMNPKGFAICSFCHESAKVDGTECDYDALYDVLVGLPAGIELAIGMNHYSSDLRAFLVKCQANGWIVNLTVNQGLIKSFEKQLMEMIEAGLVFGVGVSYRPNAPVIPEWLLGYENTVVHVIETIDSFEEVFDLAQYGVKKILVLGEKDFGFNLGKIDLSDKNRAKWFNRLPLLFSEFDVVSFDNLGLERLKPERFLSKEKFSEIYQGEHSFYINAVDKTFSRSSRSHETQPYQSVKEYFSNIG